MSRGLWAALFCVCLLGCGSEREPVVADTDDAGADVDLDADDECASPYTFYRDADGDTYGDPRLGRESCDSIQGYVLNSLDCVDGDPLTNPGAAEICDGLDNNCDGQTDENLPDCAWVDPSCIEVELLRPEVLFVVERSCAMNEGQDGVRRWDTLVPALLAVMDQFGDFSFGGLLFPDRTSLDPDENEDACLQAETIPFSPGEASAAAAFRDRLMNSTFAGDPWEPGQPCKSNPDCGVAQALGTWENSDGRSPRSVVLVSSGTPTDCTECGGWDGAAQNVLSLREQGVTTHVIRFGGTRGMASLNAIATAGGAPAGQDSSFHDARANEQLLPALVTVADRISDCSRAVDLVPADKQFQVRVGDDAFLEGGWTLSNGRLRLEAEPCARADELGWDTVQVLGCDR